MHGEGGEGRGGGRGGKGRRTQQGCCDGGGSLRLPSVDCGAASLYMIRAGLLLPYRHPLLFPAHRIEDIRASAAVPRAATFISLVSLFLPLVFPPTELRTSVPPLQWPWAATSPPTCWPWWCRALAWSRRRRRQRVWTRWEGGREVVKCGWWNADRGRGGGCSEIRGGEVEGKMT